MNDFERRLKESLRSVGESYEPEDPPEARRRFLVRRRRRTIVTYTGGIAFAGACVALALSLLPASETTETSPVPVTGPNEAIVGATIEVGNGPRHVVYGEDGVWVAATSEGTIVRIDPVTSEVVDRIEVGGSPDLLMARFGYVWVMDTAAASMTRIDPGTGRVAEPLQIGTGPHHDIAGGEGDIWVLEEGGLLYRVDGESFTIQDAPYEVGEDPTQLVVVGGRLWVFDRAAGMLRQYSATTGAFIAETEVGTSRRADLTAGLGEIWFYRISDGALLRIDRAEAVVTNELPMPGGSGGLAVGEGAVWALVGHGDGDGSLYQIDQISARRVNAPVSLSGRPFALDVGGGAVWVTNELDGTVTRLDVVPVGDREELVQIEPVDTGSAIFFASAAGDIFLFRTDGTIESVVTTDAFETSPTVSPDSTTLVYQRGGWVPGDALPRIVALDLATGAQRDVARGTDPAFGEDGRLAWVDPGGGGSAPRLLVSDIGAESAVELAAAPGDTGDSSVTGLSWGSETELLYMLTDADGATTAMRTDIATATVVEVAVDAERGEVDRAIAAGPQGPVVVRACCTTGAGDPLEIAELTLLDGAGPTKLGGLDDVGLDPNRSPFVLVPAGTLDYEADDGWTIRQVAAWFVGDGDSLWLVDANRERDHIEFDGVTSLAVIPSALSP